MVKYYIRIQIWICCIGLYGQSPELNLISIGTGPFVSTDQSALTLFRNMAGMVESDSRKILVAYHLPFQIKELQSFIFGVSIPSNPCLGITIFKSGGEAFRNQQIAISGSKKVEGVNLGVRLKYWNLLFAGHEPIHAWSLAVGIQVPISEKILAGVFINNVTQNKIGKEILPTVWFSGISYRPIEKLKLVVESGLVDRRLMELQVGLDYLIKEKVSIRGGISSLRKQGYFGVGFKLAQWTIDYALAVHFALGVSQQAGLIYSWH